MATIKRAAGILFTDGNKIILLKRTGKKKSDQTWSIPGGKFEFGETSWEAAYRETKEEIGDCPLGKLFGKIEDYNETFEFVTYLMYSPRIFKCKLSDEHIDWNWFDIKELGKLFLHNRLAKKLPKIKILIERLKKEINQ